MKKLLFSILTAISVATCFGIDKDEQLIINGETNKILAVCRNIMNGVYTNNNFESYLIKHNYLSTYFIESYNNVYKYFPQYFEYYNRTVYGTNSIVYISRMNSNNGNGMSYNFTNIDDIIDYFNSVKLINTKYSIYTSKHTKEILSKLIIKDIKKYLRSQNKSFVTKDGINPLKPYIDEWNIAVNGTLSDINNYISKFGITKKFDCDFITEQEFHDIGSKLLDGEISNIPNETKERIILTFGVQQYNSLIKEYNGD